MNYYLLLHPIYTDVMSRMRDKLFFSFPSYLACVSALGIFGKIPILRYWDLYLDAKCTHQSIYICTTSCHNLNLKRNSYISIDVPARDTFFFPQLVYRYPSFFPSPLIPFPSTPSSLLRIPLRWKGNKLRNEASPYTFIHHHVFPFPLVSPFLDVHLFINLLL